MDLAANWALRSSSPEKLGSGRRLGSAVDLLTYGSVLVAVNEISKLRALRWRELFNCDLQRRYSAKFVLLFVFYISVYPFVALLKATHAEIRTLFLSSRY